jgi:hypothetical protein
MADFSNQLLQPFITMADSSNLMQHCLPLTPATICYSVGRSVQHTSCEIRETADLAALACRLTICCSQLLIPRKFSWVHCSIQLGYQLGYK